MPRNPQDSTRFTSTPPYASSKSILGTASTIPLSSTPIPPNETPQQKVTRLREAARRAKAGQESGWEKVVLKGRLWADRAHRVTATGLIFASVIATSFALLSFGDMMIANRHKKKEWYASQQAAYDRALATAREAEANGTLTQDLALFLNKERAIEQAELAKKEGGTLWSRTRERVFRGLKMDEVADPGSAAVRQVRGISEQAQAAMAVRGGIGAQVEPEGESGLFEMGRGDAVEVGLNDESRLMERSPISPARAAENTRIADGRHGRQRSVAVGGPLDQVAEKTTQDLASAGRMWWAWVTGRR